MINLLPPETKRQIKAARTNVVLYRYCVLVLCTALLLMAVFGVAFWSTYSDKQFAIASKADSDTAAQGYAKTRAAAESFAKDLTSAKTILASNVSFSQLILDIAKLVPGGVILNNLTLGGTTTPNTPIDINGQASSYQGAIALKNSLDSSPIFENVSIVNISQTDTSSQSASALAKKYPFSVSLKAQFTKTALGQGASK